MFHIRTKELLLHNIFYHTESVRFGCFGRFSHLYMIMLDFFTEKTARFNGDANNFVANPSI